jgi:hypothetical protein
VDRGEHGFGELDCDASPYCFAGDVSLASSLTIVVPHKIDENLWRNREQLEEAIDLLKNKKPAAVSLSLS